MGLSINTIITLENDKKYIILNETLYNGNKYFLAMGVSSKKEIKSSDVVIFLEIVEGLEIYVKIVTDPELKINLSKLLKEQL